MKKQNDVGEGDGLWDGISEEDFLESDNTEDVNTSEYDKEKMRIFIANMNLARQIPRFMDSLKPVERRILYTLYEMKAFPNGPNKKSNKIIGETGVLHPHGDSAIYESIASMVQYWKRQVPLIDGKGENFGSTEDSTPAHARYTGATLSEYSYECFFEDYDVDCVEMIYNEGAGEYEPAALPAKFPNILINGVFALAMGNLIYIPPYNVEDVMNLTCKLLKNPNYSNCYIVPDFPTGCDIVDDGSWKQICEKGFGKLIIQSIITIESGTCIQGRKKTPAWALHVRNLPWLVELKSFEEKLATLVRNKELSIIDAQNERRLLRRGMKSDIVIDYCVYVERSHDPYEIREKLWSRCGLRKTLPVNFKAVEEGYNLSDRLNVRTLLLSWIDTRREYKRRLYNKKLSELEARNNFLRIFVEITGSSKLEKTLNIIRNSSTSDAREQLMRMTEMSSYQADKLLGMRISSFTKDMRERYIEEIEKNNGAIDHYSKLIRNPKKIDEIIELELKELKKYKSDRKSQLIGLTGKVIPDTLHSVVVTKMGYVKKFLYEKAKTNNIQIGAMKNGDYPVHYICIKNLNSLLVLDDSGRMTNIPVHEIPSTDSNQIGTDVFSVFKLNGVIIRLLPWVSADNEDAISNEIGSDLFFMTLSEAGYIKKTPLQDMRNSFGDKPAKAVKITGLKDYDRLVYASVLPDNTDIIIYTEQGRFKPIEFKSIPTMSKSSQGLLSIKMDEDRCIGIVPLETDSDSYLVVVTTQGCMKKISMNHVRLNGNRKDDSMLLTSLDPGDSVYSIGITSKGVAVVTRSGTTYFDIDDIPELGTRAKCKKMIPLQFKANIISVSYG